MSKISEQIRAAADLPRRSVDVPEWGVSFFIRSLTGLERANLEDAIATQKTGNKVEDTFNLVAGLLILTAVGESGESVFTREDVTWLRHKNSAVLFRLFEVATDVNGMTKKDQENLVKNSESGQPSDSPSGSPAS